MDEQRFSKWNDQYRHGRPVADNRDASMPAAQPGLRDFWLQAVPRPARSRQVVQANPWDKLSQVLTVDLDGEGPTIVAYTKATRQVVAVKSCPIDQSKAIVSQIIDLNIAHPNLIRYFNAFEHMSKIFIVHEALFTTLSHVISAPLKLREEQIALICRDVSLPFHTIIKYVGQWLNDLHQVLNGMSHLASLGIIHGAITPSNILISQDGVCKIGNLTLCAATGRMRGPSGLHLMEIGMAAVPAVGFLCMEMMEPAAMLLAEIEPGTIPTLNRSGSWSSPLLSFVDRATGEDTDRFKDLEDMKQVGLYTPFILMRFMMITQVV